MYIMYSIVGLKTNYMYTANLDAAKIYNRNFDEWGGIGIPKHAAKTFIYTHAHFLVKEKNAKRGIYKLMPGTMGVRG